MIDLSRLSPTLEPKKNLRVIRPDDAQLRAVIEEGLPEMASIPDVIALMARTQETLARDQTDGLQWFNLLYMMVTEEILKLYQSETWRSPRWLEHLVVDFAWLYFDGVLACLNGEPRAPKTWRVLMDRRWRAGVANVQYVILGINAHINRDLMLAVASAYQKAFPEDRGGPAWDGPEYADFDRVNGVLDEVQITAMRRMATGLLKEVVRVSRGMDRVVAGRLVRSARDAAFANSMVCWRLRHRPEQVMKFVGAVDRVAWVAARAFALRTEHRALAA
jgi:hypothetical protein